MRKLRSRRGTFSWSAVAVVMALLATAVLAACGSSDKSSSSTTAGSSTAAAKSGDAGVVAQSKKVVALSNGKLVYSANPTPDKASDIVPYGDWRGPSSAPPHQSGKKVTIILCTKQAAACVAAGNAAKAAAANLGWSANIVDGGGTPQGFATAWDSAINGKSDAIMGIAVPTAAVGDKLTKAKQAGIVTVATGDVPPASGTAYDAYVPFPMPTMNAILAYNEIARTNGKANTILIEDPGFPSLVQAADEYVKIMKQCSGCKTKVVKWQITDAADPTKVQKIIAGAIASNAGATAIVMPYGIGEPAVIQAVDSAGKTSQIKVIAKDADPVGLGAVAQGSSPYNAGASPQWAGWASIDQIIRGLAKKPYLEGAQTGLGVTLFTPQNAPKSGNIDDFNGLIDYAAKYKQIWK
jgi:ribose transport system substrate-binding protein